MLPAPRSWAAEAAADLRLMMRVGVLMPVRANVRTIRHCQIGIVRSGDMSQSVVFGGVLDYGLGQSSRSDDRPILPKRYLIGDPNQSF